MKELKPCPFCGGKARIKKRSFYFWNYDGFKVMCEKCGSSTKKFPKPDWAAMVWNSRGGFSDEMKIKAKEIKNISDTASKNSPLSEKERYAFVEGLSIEQVYCLAMVMVENREMFGGTASGNWDTTGLVNSRLYDAGGFCDNYDD